jgi:titin
LWVAVAESGTNRVMTSISALTPTFGDVATTVDGFVVQLSNFDAAFTWTAMVTSGSVTVDGSGLVTVTGLASNTDATVTVTTTRTGYMDGSADVTGTSRARNFAESDRTADPKDRRASRSIGRSKNMA